MYTISYKDRMTGKIITDKWIRYKNKWRNSIDVEHMISYERDEIIDHQKREISKLKTELSARLKQVEDLQSSYKTLQEENKKLKSKLEQTVDEYDEDYQTFHNNCKCTKKCGEEELHPYGRSIADYIDINDERFKKIFRDFLGDDLF